MLAGASAFEDREAKSAPKSTADNGKKTFVSAKFTTTKSTSAGEQLQVSQNVIPMSENMTTDRQNDCHGQSQITTE